MNAPTPKPGGCYVGVPEIFSLGQVCEIVARAFGEHACYLVGSATERPDFRDVDVRLIMNDDKWHALFGSNDNGEILLFWSVINTALSEYIARRTGLRIDFQVQSMTQANGALHGKKPRHPLGIFIRDEAPEWSRIPWTSKPKLQETET